MTTATRRLSAVDPARLYSLSELAELTGLGKAAIRQAKRDGLRVRYYSRFGFVVGGDLVDFLIANAKPSKSAPRNARSTHKREAAR